MIMICKHKCFFLGRSIKKGMPVDIPEDKLKSGLVKSSFITPETAEATKEAEKEVEVNQDKAELSYDELKRRLDEMGVAYKGNASKKVLANIHAAQVAARADVPPTA